MTLELVVVFVECKPIITSASPPQINDIANRSRIGEMISLSREEHHQTVSVVELPVHAGQVEGTVNYFDLFHVLLLAVVVVRICGVNDQSQCASLADAVT